MYNSRISKRTYNKIIAEILQQLDSNSNIDYSNTTDLDIDDWRDFLLIENVDNTSDSVKPISNPVQSVFTMMNQGMNACKTLTQLAFYIRGATDNCTIESIQCVEEF